MTTDNDVRRAHDLLDELDARAELSQEQEKLLRSFLPDLPKQKALAELTHDVHDAWIGADGNDWDDEAFGELETWLKGLHTQLQGLAPAAPELAHALAEETWEYQVQTRTQRMPTWLAITDDTLQKWYPEDKYKNLIRSKQGSGWVEVRVLRRRVSPPEVINE